MGSLEHLQRNWETFARADPMWAALMDPDRIGRRWDTDDFFAAGEQEIATVFARLASIGVTPETGGCALDFGCGIGRLTQALGARFDSACGVDISPTMVSLAREANTNLKCSFHLNESSDLATFESDAFVFVYTSVVLQHIDPSYSTAYIREFVRLLAPGGVVVLQIPDRIQAGQGLAERARLLARRTQSAVGLRTRLQRALRRSGVVTGEPTVRDATAEMHCVPEAEIRRLLAESGAEVVDVALTNSTDLDFIGGLRYLEHLPSAGFVSKQYSAIKAVGR